jgi:cysteine desulfurase / selenocysteine lyase
MIKCYKADFPIFQSIPDLIYLDSANTTHKPRSVLDAMLHFYTSCYASPHRGDYTLAYNASLYYQEARNTVKNFINAKEAHEIIFTHGATHSINLVANGLHSRLKPGDRIILSKWEHSSNILPWKILSEELNIDLIYLNDWNDLPKYISYRTKLIGCNYYSHTTGTRSPVEYITKIAKAHNILVLVDGTQAVAHTSIDVTYLDCDFFVFSGHKLYAPNGVGILYIKEPYRNIITPSEVGGGQILDINLSITKTYPDCMEAGTPNLPAIIGLDKAIKYLDSIGGMNSISSHVCFIKDYAVHKLKLMNIPTHYGEGPVISIQIPEPYDLACILGARNICVRSGYLCNHLLNQGPLLRLSLGIYNSTEDIDIVIQSIQEFTA